MGRKTMRVAKRFSIGLASGTSLIALALSAAHAQQAAAVEGDIEEVVVTGSRLTTGFETATPVTAITMETLTQAAPVNLLDSLKQLPALAASASANQTGSGTGAS